jgi:transcription-repair coupling factor (superfamily II helicase)
MINLIRDNVRQTDQYHSLRLQLERLAAGGTVDVSSLPGSLRHVVLGILAEDLQRQLLLVVDKEDDARKAADDLALAVGHQAVHVFDAMLTRAVEGASPNVEDVETLHALLDGHPKIVVTYRKALTQGLPAPGLLKDKVLTVQRGSECDFAALLGKLVQFGFVKQQYVQAVGEYSQRGGILDVYPYTGENPVRIEFDGDTVESIREFDPLSQRSIRELSAASIVPDLLAVPAHAHTTLLDYLHPQAILAMDESLDSELQEESLGEQSGKLSWRQVLELSMAFARIRFVPSAGSSEPGIAFGASPQPAINSSIKVLRHHLTELQEKAYRIILASDTEAEQQRLRELLAELEPLAEDEERTAHLTQHVLDISRLEFSLEALHEGFIFPAARLAVFTEHQIFNRLKRRGKRRRAKFKGITQRELHELRKGDYVVHADFGIGRFDGLKKIVVRDVEQEVVKLLYEENDTLYVNLNYLNKIQKYSSKDGHVPKLTRLGTGEWERLKAKAKKRVKDIARELILLYAKRRSSPGFAFSRDTLWQRELEASFMYEDTPDQAKATEEVKRDMEAAYPMDRLICGDVGFGKTEVAVRAAFKAVMSGKQVALLVPTTILAQQHYNTFVDRLSHYTTKIEVISRFKTKKEQAAILQSLAAGTTDIIIGTHRLLSRDVVFKDLGLLIIDEEHRFGVAAKEKLRQMKATVDTLTLTATPIPRTLHFSLLGARDLSIIATPPRNRLPVITEIMQYDDALIREAILREIQRGGQVFFVHDRVQTMDELVDRLQTLVPNVRVRKAHGQMAAHELEEVMLAFLERKFDVLVATKIIESGIDIPNVNTIIINRADRFGMAELYQLRGRVGRSNVQAYAYLLVPPISSLPRETVRRLQAVEEFTELGSGFNLAMRDLEIRGAGNLLGGEQSGFIEAMGFEMYTRVLEEAVAELKEQEFQEMFQQQRARTSAREQTVVDAEFDVRIPEVYIDDGNERLSVYRRLFGVSGVEEVDAIAAELKDRFGPYPQAVEHLLELVRLRLKATMMGFRKLTVGKKSVVLEFPPESDTQFYESAAFQSLMSHVSHMNKKQAVLRQQGKTLSLVYSVDPSSGADPFHTAHHLLDELLDLSQNASERAQAVTAG